MTLDQSQRAAVDAAKAGALSIITGGAGTGKTTIIKAIVKSIGGHWVTDEITKDDGEVICDMSHSSINLCAFAGKAAARLKEATGCGASTIHRMLGYMGEGTRFTRGPMRGETVIIDEASMVSSDLLAEIVRRSPARLVLVGDQAQLPPVGCGQPFHDLIAMRPDLVSTLTTCYRNAEAVFKAASAIRAGDMPLGYDKTKGETWRLVPTGGATETHQWVCDQVAAGEIDFSQDIILSARNGEEGQKAACESLNLDLSAIVNPRKGDAKLQVGDRVINTKNFADIDVWNGTTGTIHSIDYDNSITIKLDVPILNAEESAIQGVPVYEDYARITRDRVKHLKLAYALTVHKAQGSQYRKVIFICLCRDSVALLDRSLIYTAVTRAKQECIVAGEIRALQDGIRCLKTKNTVMQELWRQGQ